MQMQKKYKIAVLGDEQVGKSSIINRFVYNEFNQDYHHTVGIDFFGHTVQGLNKSIRFQIWDTAGKIEFRSLVPSYIRDSLVAIVCYDVTNEESFQSIFMWIEMIYEEKGKDVLIYIVGNKTDLEESRKVDFNKAKQMALAFNAQYFETSAQSGHQINDLFLKLATDLSDENFELYHYNKEKLFNLQYGKNQINRFVD